MQIYQIGTSDIKSLCYRDIVLVMLAEGGAMGEPGAVVIVEKQKHGARICHANYCYGDFDMDEFAEKFPPLRTFDCGLFGKAAGIPRSWRHVDLGAGNHLLVRKRIYPEFAACTAGMSPPEIYQNYLEIGVKILMEKEDDL